MQHREKGKAISVSKEEYWMPSNITLIMTGITALILFVFLIAMIIKTVNAPYIGSSKTPEVVTDLLDALIIDGDPLEEILSVYLEGFNANTYGDFLAGEVEGILEETEDSEVPEVTVTDENTKSFYSSRKYLSFNYIFFTDDVEYSGYTLTNKTNGCVEILLKDKYFQDVYPRVLFAYELSDDGSLIKDFTLARLQPLAKKSEEYSEKWSS